MMQNQLAALSSATVSTVEQKDGGDAPPKQVALAMERLAQAARLIADVRLGADRFLEALLATEDQRQLKKSLQLIVKAESSMRQHLQDLRNLGKQLEESGVLNQSLKSRGDSWGLHMPLVCPDGAVVAYAWKRQLAGQAGASAVDRTRLALKAFTDQKKRFFPHLEEDTASHSGASEFGLAKRHYGSQGLVDSIRGSSLGDTRTLSDILFSFEKETPNMKIFTYQRLDWSRRVFTLSPSSSASSSDPSKEQNYPNKPRLGLLGSTPMDQVAIIELFVPLVFRAVVSLHPAGSTNPDSVAFFSPDEGGNYIHARGISVHHVFKHLTEHADKALQYFLSIENDGALDLLLHWIASYQTLFSKACSKCRRLIVVDKSFGLLLPPVYRSYQQTLSAKQSTPQSTESTKELTPDRCSAYHIGCYSDES